RASYCPADSVVLPLHSFPTRRSSDLTILRWALTQPGFEQLFTNNEMYIMQPTNLQPVTRYFSQQDSMRIGSSMFHEPTILGSKIDRKSTRLNSSHVSISYAVFCLKKN